MLWAFVVLDRVHFYFDDKQLAAGYPVSMIQGDTGDAQICLWLLGFMRVNTSVSNGLVDSDR